MSNTAIVEAILSSDSKTLSVSSIESLINILPTPEEISEVHGFEGDASTLASSDVFVGEVSSIPGLAERLKALKFYVIYQEYTDEIESRIGCTERVLKNIKESKNLRLILLYSLAMGNFLNG